MTDDIERDVDETEYVLSKGEARNLIQSLIMNGGVTKLKVDDNDVIKQTKITVNDDPDEFRSFLRDDMEFQGMVDMYFAYPEIHDDLNVSEEHDGCIEETDIHPKALQDLGYADDVLSTQIQIMADNPNTKDPFTLIKARESIQRVLDADEKSPKGDGSND